MAVARAAKKHESKKLVFWDFELHQPLFLEKSSFIWYFIQQKRRLSSCIDMQITFTVRSRVSLRRDDHILYILLSFGMFFQDKQFLARGKKLPHCESYSYRLVSSFNFLALASIQQLVNHERTQIKRLNAINKNEKGSRKTVNPFTFSKPFTEAPLHSPYSAVKVHYNQPCSSFF